MYGLVRKVAVLIKDTSLFQRSILEILLGGTAFLRGMCNLLENQERFYILSDNYKFFE